MQVRKLGEKRARLGQRAWEVRQKYGYSWEVVGRIVHSSGGNCRKAAEDWALSTGKSWPLPFYSTGRMLYEMLKDGWSLREIRAETHIEVYNARKYARDYAKRNGFQWPLLKPCPSCGSEAGEDERVVPPEDST
jgi:hypothetical protein